MRQHPVHQQAGRTDDAVQRCADFMAHHGEEFRTRPACRLGGVARRREVLHDALAFGDIRIGAHRSAARQRFGVDLKHGSIGPGAFVQRNLCIETATGDLFADRRIDVVPCVEFIVLGLPLHDGLVARSLERQVRWQPEQFAGPAVAHRDPVIAIDHDDALAHVLQRRRQSTLIARQPLTVPRQKPGYGEHQQ